jgi:AraC-like DNA-binding protein
MERDFITCARTALDGIEATLHEKVDVFDIIRESSYSPFHFQRRFRALTGYSVADYIRRRKLSRAAVDLCIYDRRVIDCAYDYGFGHEQSFIRAFVREFGVTPGAFRRDRIDIHIQRNLSRDYFDDAGGMLCSPFSGYTIRHGVSIVGIRRRFAHEENSRDSLCEKMKAEFLNVWLPKLHGIRSSVLYGIDEMIPEKPTEFSVTMGVVTDGIQVPAGMVSAKLPFHIAADLPVYISKSPELIKNADYEPAYIDLHNKYIPESVFSHRMKLDYTTADLDGVLSSAPVKFLIHIPVEEKK